MSDTAYRYKDDADSPTEEEAKPKVLYGVEFTFDADARVAITLYCQAFEEFSNGMAA
jgi:E3 ubiquitin-protein ligase MGRN1